MFHGATCTKRLIDWLEWLVNHSYLRPESISKEQICADLSSQAADTPHSFAISSSSHHRDGGTWQSDLTCASNSKIQPNESNIIPSTGSKLTAARQGRQHDDILCKWQIISVK
ncbi:hypothetical protein M514_21794 [Trichuris suis]|uniref:Uncharacterized protein n=1 Tax=Trichuris suis TaxID=68888 RepID=A0A085N925_9BILA|nr:hypothetical protein M514_21794 [Trichuris suis]